MRPFPKWACLIMGVAMLGVLRAEDATIYEVVPRNATTLPDVPSISINDTPVQVASIPRSEISSKIKPIPRAATSAKTEATAPVTDPKSSTFPWKKKIVTTTFWIGQDATTYNNTTNYKSAWDTNWTKNYGGTDNPTERFGFLPKSNFAVTQNPFYIALPFNDVKYPELARKWVPWYDKQQGKEQRYVSQCKGRWIEIRNKEGKSCFAQWQDVGPFRYDHAAYVFGNDRPNTYNKAGLDVSPAVKTHLGLSGLDVCDWRFVEAWEVKPGPWITYGEQAIVLAAIKQREAQSKLTRTAATTRRSKSTVTE